MPSAPQVEPPAIKVFGVIHLVFAGIGFLTGAWNLMSSMFSHMFLDSRSPAYQAQLRMQTELHWVALMTGAFLILLAILLLISGLKLVRSQPDGIPWSNRYAWTSIATKLISLAVTVIWVLPVMKQGMNDVMANSGLPGGMEKGMSSAMGPLMTISSILTPVFSCIYPVLALYFLNRADAKAWRSGRLAGAP
jgi:hypothetical protein